MPSDNPGPASPERPSSTASSSLYRRQGLSPRQRRLLQSAARARANNNTEQGSATTSHTSPSQISPASLNTSLSPIEHSTPDDETFEHLTKLPPRSLSSSLEKISHKSVGGASATTDATTVSSTATTDATTVSIGSRFSQLRLNRVNDEEEVVGAMRGKVSDRIKRFNGGSQSNVTSFKRLNEEDENDTEDVTINGPLNSQGSTSPSRTIQPKISYQKQQLKLNPEEIRHGWRNDILKTAAKKMELRHYRLIYPGVVSLLTDLPGAADANRSKNCNSNETCVYLGYGDIVATSSPEITISLSELEKSSHKSCNESNKQTAAPEIKFIRAIRVDSILTGGCNSDDKECIASDPSVPSSWKNSTIRHHGYLLLDNQFGETIAESMAPTKPGSMGPTYEHGSFIYRVRASSPIRVLSGPDFNAPSMKCALIPGTTHDVTFRVSMPVSDTTDNDADVLVDDADAGEIKFLRLGHRRGWVADRRIDAVDGDSKRLRVSYLMQDVTEESLNHTFSGTSFAESPNTSMSQSLDCSSLNLSVNASSVTTPTAVNTQRKRTRRRRRETQNVPAMLQENRHPGDSFDTESSATGFGSGTVISTATESIIDQKYGHAITTFYLMRVLAPSGLKILDAPHFQVSNLIHTPTEQNKLKNQSPAGISPFARTNAMIGSSSAESSPSSLGVNRKGQRIRFLARGQFFEASNRMESTDAASLYTNGQGLIKLADGSGWVIIPHHHELVSQYENFRGGSVDAHEILAFEELGDATIEKQSHNRLTPPDRSHHISKNPKQNKCPVRWLRIVSPNGVKVLLPPADIIQRNNHHSHITPPKYPTPREKAIIIKPSSSSQDSEVASAVSSSFFDSVWSRVSPTKQKGTVSSATTILAANKQIKPQRLSSLHQKPYLSQPTVPVISCGMVVPVEYSDSACTSTDVERCFVRLFNSQGWIPRRVVGTTCAVEVDTPEARFGSFWFRVQSKYGVDVRHGPSLHAPYITSDSGHSFRFECGEFLRASEVLTVFHKEHENGGSEAKVECFARLYRKNQVLDVDPSVRNAESVYSSIQSLAVPGEWVAVHDSGALFLEECSTPPLVERNRDGWRCSAIHNIYIRSGPSFNAGRTTKVIRTDEEFLVSEKVSAAGDSVVWYRLKNDEGWVHSVAENGDAMVHCHLDISQSDFSRKLARNIINR